MLTCTNNNEYEGLTQEKREEIRVYAKHEFYKRFKPLLNVGLKGSEIFVYLFINDCHKYGIHPSINDISYYTECSKSTIPKTIKRLNEKGMLTKHRYNGKKSIYKLSLDLPLNKS
jgi:DNA-binding MarR family transcriptional regulator